MKQKLKSSSKNIITVVLALILSMGAFLIPAAAVGEDVVYYPMTGYPFGYQAASPSWISGLTGTGYGSGQAYGFFGGFGLSEFYSAGSSSFAYTNSAPTGNLYTTGLNYPVRYSATTMSGYLYLYLPYTSVTVSSHVDSGYTGYFDSVEVIAASSVSYGDIRVISSQSGVLFRVQPHDMPSEGSYIRFRCMGNLPGYTSSYLVITADESTMVNPYPVSDGGGDSGGGATEVTISYFSIVLAMLLAVLLVLGFFII